MNRTAWAVLAFAIGVLLFENVSVSPREVLARFLPSDKGAFDPRDSIYRNDAYKFSLALPAEWRIVPPADAIRCPTILREYLDSYFLIAAPGSTDDALLIVDLMSLGVEHFEGQGWPDYVATTVHGRPVAVNETAKLNGLSIRRLGYKGDGFYREDIYFQANGKMIELYFYALDSSSSDRKVAQMRAVIERGLRAL